VESCRGLSPEGHLARARQYVEANPSDDPNDVAVVVIDVGGDAGAKVRGVFAAYMQAHWSGAPFRVVYVDSSRKGPRYQRQPQAFDRVRDELVGNMADWIRAGGAIPREPALARQMNEYRWLEQPVGRANKLVDKRTMRAGLGGESPDLGDALALSCWGERHWRPAPVGDQVPPAPEQAGHPADIQGANEIWYEVGGGPMTAGEDDPWWPKS
jgi:hypothetical protein